MHRPLKFATVVAVALAFTGCADSAPRGITEPDGLRPTHLSESVSPALDEVFHKAEALLNDLYACAGTRQIGAKNNDLKSVSDFAAAGKWDQVKSGINKIIKDTDELIAKRNGGIPSSCLAGNYSGETEREALKTETYLWLRVFQNQGNYQGGEGEGASFPCSGLCDEQTTGPNGYGFTGNFSPGTFVVIRPYTKAIANSVGNAFEFELVGGESIGPWTTWICWNGYVGDEDVSPPPALVAQFRIANEGTVEEVYELLPTTWDDARCVQKSASLNPILKGAYKLFAGLPFLPSRADAYVPSFGFGGTGTIRSPVFLRVLDPQNDPFDALCLATSAISPPTANAACGFLVKASQCTTASCTNTELGKYIHAVTTAIPQQISEDDAAPLILIAEGLMQP